MSGSMVRNTMVMKGAGTMNMPKRFVCGLLGLMLVLCLVACTKDKPISAEDMVGTWQREVVFLPYFKAEVELALELNEDGSYEKTVTNHENGKLLETEEGTWTFDGAKLVCVKARETATMTYEYDRGSNTLENAGYEYKKIS